MSFPFRSQQLSVLPEHDHEYYERPIDVRRSLEGGEASCNLHAVSKDGSRRTTTSIDNQLYQAADDQGKESTDASEDGSASEPEEIKRGWFVAFISRRIHLPKGAFKELCEKQKAREEAADLRPRRGMFLLPLMSPYNPISLYWLGFMLLFDLTYTVISCMQSSHGVWNFFHAVKNRRRSGCRSTLLSVPRRT